MVIESIKNVFKRDKILQRDTEIKGYRVEEILGEGRYGIAYLAKDKFNNKVVIKQLKKGMLKMSKEKLRYEKEVLKSLNNEFFPRFIDEFQEEDLKGYIIQYKDGRTYDEIIYNEGYVFSRSEILQVAGELIKIIEILDNNNIVHKDIRVSNVVVNDKNEMALIDFGLARFIDNKKYTRDMDFWYLGDFMIHMYYTSYKDTGKREEPWYEELQIPEKDRQFLKKLMGIDVEFKSLQELKKEFEVLKAL